MTTHFTTGVPPTEEQERFYTTECITRPLPTTYTVNCKVNGVKVDAKSFIEKILATPKDQLPPRILGAKCNFGEYTRDDPTFWDPPVVVKTTRGRKKIIRPITNIKKQGTGKAFNSQVTFGVAIDPALGPNKKDFTVVKLFNNGLCQLAGQKPEYYVSSREVIEYLIVWIRTFMNMPDAQCVSFCVNMKNAKMKVRLNEQQFINREKMFNLLTAPEHKAIIANVETKITASKVSCSFRFYPPGNHDAKSVTVVIQSSGKINIQGANETTQIQFITNFLSDLIEKNRSSMLKFRHLSAFDDNVCEDVEIFSLCW
jgi:hypothetical protein